MHPDELQNWQIIKEKFEENGTTDNFSSLEGGFGVRGGGNRGRWAIFAAWGGGCGISHFVFGGEGKGGGGGGMEIIRKAARGFRFFGGLLFFFFVVVC